MEEVRAIDALLNGDDVERMVIDENAQRPRRDAPPVEPPLAPRLNVVDRAPLVEEIDENAQRPRRDAPPIEPPLAPRLNVVDRAPLVEEIRRPPSPAEHAPILLDVLMEPPAAPAAVVLENEGAVGGVAEPDDAHQNRRHRALHRRWRGRGGGNFHFRGVRAGQQIRQRRRAREFAQFLGMLSRQAFGENDD
ncbi:hypothetical protein QAD02_017956 [Eretmocerus hayati]|uniref:Uncharacterized protein n=2 Tax=Eretmocerus hayati TaxID=131215 RepID=A0ACC2PF22_9HYME|nr:hypothetical protein QAD02_013526 [Eretmocerus hayati]KAJ8682164.1 hypothetical protein QAD02_017956 [Eretmocerus hayati]